MFYSVDRADKDYVMIGRFIYDDEETTKRRQKMAELQMELFK